MDEKQKLNNLPALEAVNNQSDDKWGELFLAQQQYLCYNSALAMLIVNYSANAACM